jgi:hypothetical protein
MQPWVISWIVFCTVGLALPTCLLEFVRRRNWQVTAPLIIPTSAIVVLAVALGHAAQLLVKWVDPGDVPAVQEFLDRAQPDAIICSNDYTAAQLLRTLTSIGIKVPEQIRVAGFDDVKYARLL